MNPKILGVLLQILPKELLKKVLDDVLDKIEARVKASPNEFDDLLLIVTASIRTVLKIE